LEEGGGEVGVVGGFVEDGSDAGAVLEFDFEGAEVVGGGVDVEVDPWDLGAEAAVAGFEGELVDFSDLLVVDDFEGGFEGFGGFEALAVEEGEAGGLWGIGGLLSGDFFSDIEEGEGFAVGDGDGFGRVAELPADFAGFGKGEFAGGGDGLLECGKFAFLGEGAFEGADGGLTFEPGIEDGGVCAGAGEGEEAEEECGDAHGGSVRVDG
jgi:hypothetical protein